MLAAQEAKHNAVIARRGRACTQLNNIFKEIEKLSYRGGGSLKLPFLVWEENRDKLLRLGYKISYSDEETNIWWCDSKDNFYGS